MRKNLFPILTVAFALFAIHALAPSSAAAWFNWPWTPPTGNAAPEIGAGAIGGAVALVGGALALLRRSR